MIQLKLSNTTEKDMWFLSLLLSLLPTPKSRPVNPSWYSQSYYTLQKRVIAWHKCELEKLDLDYAELQGTLKLLQARKMADEQGIGSMDSRYPDMSEYIPHWKQIDS